MNFQNISPLKAERRDLVLHGNIFGAALLAGLVVSTLFSAIMQLVIAAVTGENILYASQMLLDSPILLYCLNTAVCFLTFVVCFAAAAKILKRNVGEIGGFNLPDNAKRAVVCIGFSFFMVFVGSFLTNLFSIGVSFVGLQPIQPEYGSIENTPFGVIFTVLTLAAAPALVEEFAFRGVLIGALRKFGDLTAVVVSSVLCSLMHGNFIQIPYTLAMGFGLAVTRILTGSIWPCVFVHFTNNLIASLGEIIPETPFLIISLAYILLSIIFGSIALAYMKKRGAFLLIRDVPSTMKPSSRICRIIFSPVMIIAAAIFLIEALTMFAPV